MEKAKILIVEDEAVIALGIESKLQSLGYEVTAVVNTGEKAIKKAETDKPDLILMDIRIKGEMDGIDAAEIIRNQFGIPVIFSTAYLDQERIERAKITMPFGYVLKPIQERDLKVTLEMALYILRADKERKKAEIKSQLNEENLLTTLESIGDAVITTDTNGHITRMNPIAEVLTGWKATEAEGKSLTVIFNIVNALTKEKALNPASEALKKGQIVGLANHTLLISRDGSQYQIADSAAPIKGSDGKIKGVVLVFRDVTEEYLMQEKIAKSEKQLRSLYDSMSEGLCQHQIVYDEKGVATEYRILDVNPQYERILNIKKDDIIGKLASIVYETDEPPYLDIYAKVAKTGKPVSFETYFSPQDRHFSISAFSTGEGKFATVFEDITVRKQNEKALTQIEWLLTKPREAKPDELTFTPGYGDLVTLNRCKVLLDSAGEVLLHEIANDYLELLDTSTAIYEKNGDYALGIFSSGWCRFLDQASRDLCKTDDNLEALSCGKWLCHESCWSDVSKLSIKTGKSQDVECNGGLRIFAVPILAGTEIVGAINFGYGNPPTDQNKLAEIAQKYEISVDELKIHSNAYETRPSFIIETAKKRLFTSAMMIGKLAETSNSISTING
jgi:PAS domain S-box-containing protein